MPEQGFADVGVGVGVGVVPDAGGDVVPALPEPSPQDAAAVSSATANATKSARMTRILEISVARRTGRQ